MNQFFPNGLSRLSTGAVDNCVENPAVIRKKSLRNGRLILGLRI